MGRSQRSDPLRVRNGGETAVNYNDFDFGYWENTGLEIRQGTNWVRLPRAGGGSASVGGSAAGKIKALAPEEAILADNGSARTKSG